MTTLIYNEEGEQIRESRNLRGLLDHARRVAPVSIHCGPPDSQGYSVITVFFANCDYAVTNWADWRVAADWFRSRRSWPKLTVWDHMTPRRYNATFNVQYSAA